MIGAQALRISMNYTGPALSDLESLRALTRMGSEVCLLSCGEVARRRGYTGCFTLLSRIPTGLLAVMCSARQLP